MKRISQEIISNIKDLANDKIEYVLEKLSIDLDSISGSDIEIRTACPVHNGSNKTAFSYNTKFKKWKCYTAHCSDNNDSIFGLVKLILSKRENREISFIDSVIWLANILNIKVDYDTNIKISDDDIEIYNYIKEAKFKKYIKTKFSNNQDNKFEPIPVSAIQNKVKISEYFLKQGFTKDILLKYNVGYCDDPTKPMYLRSFAPVLNEEGDMVLGATGRIVYEKCHICGDFHDPSCDCPVDNPRVRAYSKWFHYGFKTGTTLYNIWFAKEYIRNSKIAILTEGPKDVWWFEQHGIHNSICIFGLKVLNFHLNKLIKLGTTSIVIALDNDEKGLEAMAELEKNLNIYFKIINLKHLLKPGNDIADTPQEDMNSIIVPYIKSLEKS